MARLRRELGHRSAQAVPRPPDDRSHACKCPRRLPFIGSTFFQLCHTGTGQWHWQRCHLAIDLLHCTVDRETSIARKLAKPERHRLIGYRSMTCAMEASDECSMEYACVVGYVQLRVVPASSAPIRSAIPVNLFSGCIMAATYR